MPNPSEPTAGLAKIRQLGIKRFLLTLPSYAAVMGILWVGALLHIVRPTVALTISGAMVAALVGLYVALHSGVAARSKDPLLAFSQIVCNLMLVALNYAWLDELRSTALLWLGVIIAFDMARLPPRQTKIAAVFCVVLPLLATAVRALWHPVPLDWMHELFTLLMLAVVLPVVFAVSAQARAMRRRHVQQKEQMAQTLDQLHQLSIRDGLTGLYNRRHMHALLDEEVRRMQRSGQPFCLTILDLDLFKQVNDRFGHAMGDTVLQTFASLGRDVFPDKADALARWGGEEFLLLQPGTTELEAGSALMRLRNEVHLHDWGQHVPGLAVTFSAGVCQHRADEAIEQTLERADQALYRAKTAGRDCIMGTDQVVASKAHAIVKTVGQAAPAACSLPVQTQVLSTPPHALSRGAPPRAPRVSPRHPLIRWLWGSNARLHPYQMMCLLALGVYLSSIPSPGSCFT